MAKNVSDNFRNIIKTGGPFYAYASVLLSTGETVVMTSEQDFTLTGNGYSEDGGTGFPLGMALSKSITLNIDNTSITDSLKDTSSDNILDYKNEDILATRKSIKTDYYQARIALYTEADLPDGTTERIREGIFTVIDAVTPGEILKITAYDDMYKADTPFTSLLSYPASAQALLNEVCAQCGITLGSVTFRNNNFQIQQAPEGLTGRQIIGYIAQIAGGNAVIDSNARLVIKTYDPSGFNQTENVSADEIETESGIHIISQYVNDPDIGTDDVTITGVTVEIENEDSDDTETYTSGTEEYALRIDNPLITGHEKEAVDLIADVVVGITIRPFSGTFMPNPTIEFMDLAYLVDKKDNQYKTFVTTHDFEYLSNSTLSNGTESPERHGGSYYSTAAEVYQKAKKDLKINRTQWEQAIENLSQQVANASGLYTTEEEQPDGSTIFYMHNKPTLEESDIVWKMTAETLTVSTDGGHSWNAGITVNGEVIARIMNTIGINFDWGVGGTLIIQDEEGNQTAYIDADTGTVRLAVESLTITGKTVQEIASEQSDETLNNFVDSVYNPAIGNLQAQIDGQIETYYYDYEPTLNNEPASEWTTEEERRNHEGDLFYWKSKGYAYRFFKDGDTWKWQMVQDTDITKALEEAADAKDTADQKRRVFVTQPYPPYDVGDLWVGDDTSEMMRCQRARSSGSYVASDWIKAVKYTDDSELYNFVQNDYNETIKDIYNSVDQKSETWYQATDPALEWTEIESTPLQDTTGANILDTAGETVITIWEKEKSLHNGDLWKNSTTNKEYLYQNGEWVEMPIPDEVFDIIDGKAQIFVSTPTPPYAIGDLWFNSATSDIMTCIVGREAGSCNASDWQKRNKYTDDSYAEEVAGDLSNFADQVVGDLENMQTQIDGKIETYYYDYQPTLSNIPASAWTTETERQKHIGDLFYYKSTGFTYRFLKDGSTWKWQPIKDEDISKALSDAADAQDTADSKRRVFTSTPTPPYDVGDLWAQGSNGDIMRCKTARSSGAYVSTDWEKASKYTDDTAVDDLDEKLNSTEEIFNRLTQNGKIKGIYLQDGQLYISFDYAKGGALVLGGNNNISGTMKILSSDGKELCVFDNTGGKITGSLYTEVENYWGREWISINGPLIESGIGEEKIATFDMAAQYADGVKLALTCQNGIIINSGNKYMSFKEQEFSVTTDNSISISSLGSGLRLDGSSMELWGNSGSLYSSYSEGFKIQTLNGMSVQSSSGIANGTTLHVYGSILVEDAFLCKGSKSRICETKDYSTRKLYCYETASPLFGDVGCGFIGEDGFCIVEIDNVFLETVNTKIEYNVFLQKEGDGDLWVDAKEQNYFVVKGTPNLKFSWECKVRQRDYEIIRMEEDLDTSDDSYIAYDALGAKLAQEEAEKQEAYANVAVQYYKELEEMFI